MISISGYNLTTTTKFIMDYLWDFPEGTSFREIYNYFTEEKGKDWKRQTLYTYLTILIQQGFLKTEGSRRRTNYIPAVSRESYRESYAVEVLQDSYDNSLVNFVSSCAAGGNIKNEEADAIITILKEYKK